MRYYIEKQKTKFVVTDFETGKLIDGTAKSIYGAINRALFDAYSNHGTIENGNLKAPSKTVHIYYKDGWAQIDKIDYAFGCKFFLNKVKERIKPQPVQLSMF